MYATHDFIDEQPCFNCGAILPYYELKQVNAKQLWCEYCLDELYQPETI